MFTKVSESRVLRRIYGPKMEGVTGGWKNCIMSSSVSSTPDKLLGQSMQGG